MLKVKEYSSFEAFEQDEHRQDVDLVAIVNKPNGMVCADLITDCKMWQTAVNRFFKALAGRQADIQRGHEYYHYMIGGRLYAGTFVGRDSG